MKRKLAYTFLILVLVAIGILTYSIGRELIRQENMRERIAYLPEFELQTLEGEQWSSRTARDSLPLIVNFFNTECPYCNAEIRSIVEDRKLRNAAHVLLISDQSINELKSFREVHRIDSLRGISLLNDRSAAVKKLFGVKTVPSTFLYSSDGNHVKSYRGEVSSEALYRQLIHHSVTD